MKRRPAPLARSLLMAALFGWCSLLLAPSAARADPVRIAVEVQSREDATSRAIHVRLLSELRAAGFSVATGTGAAAARASLVRNGHRWTVFVELTDGSSLVVRADDVLASELPAVLALRAVERLCAVLSAPPSLPTSSASTSPERAVAPPAGAPIIAAPIVAAPPDEALSAPAVKIERPTRPLLAEPFVAAGSVVSVDDGAVSIAPIFSAGVGLGAGVSVRASGWGPSTETAATAPQGSAAISAFGGLLDVGVSRPVREGTTLGAAVGIGGAGYVISGRAEPGFVGRSETKGAALAAVHALITQRIAGPLHLFADVGLLFAIPSVTVRIAGQPVAERGSPAITAASGALVAF